MRSENEFFTPQLDSSTGGQGVDSPPVEQELAAETARIRRLHALLATELAVATAQARGSLAAPTGGEFSARWERDVAVHRWSERVGALTAARSGLCFGRLDHTDGSTSYIGRIGLTDLADGESALVDWRAPASRPFYCATLAMPLGLTRRRHFEIAGMAPAERVADFHDDVLDRDTDSGSASDPALLAALKAPRGSTMRDIVTTIQAEQDAIIRLPLSGVVVIEGGPGTGKTAVALHRVAYLLYTHRERLARSGVLVVGPSAGFIRYVGGVLPALGESAVVFTTPGRPAPRSGPDSAYAAEVLDILESADRQLVGEDPDELRPTDFVTADVLAARQVAGRVGTVAERAAADRDWRYGHLVVDEAQELSAMDWHVLLRRCPSGSITAVGDLAQRSAPAGAREWADVLAPHLDSRWTYRTLTVNYRTPAEIMALAAGVLAEFAPDRQPPESVRATGEEPWQRTVPAADLVAEVVKAVEAEVAQLGRGTLAVIAGDESGLAGLSVQLHTPVSAKGLEFDVVVIVDPERIRAHNPADLYVSMTRATQRLGLLHVGR